MTTHLLTRKHHRPSTGHSFLGDLTLTVARTHEFCGNSRHTLAMLLIKAYEGPVFWIQPGWLPEWLHGDGMRSFISPGRINFVSVRRPEDLLWCTEEALRSGVVPLVIADLPAPPPLTPVRRLHLACETGAGQGLHRPLGLLLTPGDGGAQGVESRWHFAAHHSAKQQGWRLTRRRARTAPVQSWSVHPDGQSYALTKTSQPD
ncbi:MAG: hypothetical protein ABJO27_24275 [Pseudoruegeria sp.]